MRARESQIEPEGTRVSERQPERAKVSKSESRRAHKPRQCEGDSLLSRYVEIRYLLSKIVKIYAGAENNGRKCAESFITLYHTLDLPVYACWTCYCLLQVVRRSTWVEGSNHPCCGRFPGSSPITKLIYTKVQSAKDSLVSFQGFQD